MPCLRIQEEKSRELSSGYTDRKHTHTNIFNFLPQGKHVVISIFMVRAVTTTLLTVNTCKHHQLFFFIKKRIPFDFKYVE